MTSWVIVDSGIFVATVVQEEYSDNALALMSDFQSRKLRLAAPSLMQYELAAAMRKLTHRSVHTSEEGRTKLQLLLQKQIVYFLDQPLLFRAYELATEHQLATAYDAQYLALAERLQCDFWTFDKRLYNTVNVKLNWVKWVGNVSTP